MLIADPVIKAEMAGNEMKSTIQPHLITPMKQMIAPAMIASADAMTWPGTCGCSFATLRTIFPVMVDMTATGPMVISFEVAKNQYINTPMKEEYKPNCTGNSASFAYAI